jgi:hypothetical protein
MDEPRDETSSQTERRLGWRAKDGRCGGEKGSGGVPGKSQKRQRRRWDLEKENDELKVGVVRR